MWARVENDSIVDVYRRPRAIRLNDVNYPPTIFNSTETLKDLGIYECVATDINVGDDNRAQRYTEEFVWDSVNEVVAWERTWFTRPDIVGAVKRDKAHRKTQGFHHTRAKIAELMERQGTLFEDGLSLTLRTELDQMYAQFQADCDAVADDPQGFKNLDAVMNAFTTAIEEK